ncbi:MAG: hypothetical protein K6U80_09915 [Firmicutes bacterium]|nr:hypothetical protein [Bacillota bacterium]
MTGAQVQEITKAINNLVNTINQVTKPSFNKWELLYSIISGVIAVGGFWFIQYVIDLRRQNKHYRNLLSLIISELRLNFIWLTDIGVKNPNKPMEIKAEIWDMVKIEASKRLPIKLVVELENTYILLKFINGKTFKEHDQVQKTNKKDVIDLIESCMFGLLELSKVDKTNKELFAKDFQDYRSEFKQTNNTSGKTLDT